MPAALTGTLAPRAGLDAAQRQQLFELMRRHYIGVDAERFRHDLEEKNWVLLLHDSAGTLRGFSSLLKYHARIQGHPITVIFSGDTIVEQRYWGSRALPRTWIRAVRSLHTDKDPSDLYWLLLTAGFRTYRFLPLFWRRFYPQPQSGDVQLRYLRDRLASDRFGRAFDPVSGVVRLAAHYRIEPRLGGPDAAARRRDTHIDYFLTSNPGHVHGDELACIASLDDTNLTAAGRRMCR